MKKLLPLLITLSVLAFSVKAQTEKGTWTAGGLVELNTSKQDGAPKSNVYWNIAPSIGYFVAHNIEVGTSIGYYYSKYYTNVGSGGIITSASVKTTLFEVSPYARVYKNITDQFKFFGQLSVPLSFGKTREGGDITSLEQISNKNHTVGAALSPGFVFFPGKKFGIEFSVNGISYNTLHYNNSDGGVFNNTKTFNIGANFFAPKIGVKFYL